MGNPPSETPFLISDLDDDNHNRANVPKLTCRLLQQRVMRAENQGKNNDEIDPNTKNNTHIHGLKIK